MKIGIIGAMPEEMHLVIGAMADKQETHIAHRTFIEGRLEGKDVVVVMSRWGKVAAAQTATTLIERYGATHVMFTGVAGGVDPSLNVGDVVIGTELVQHDMDVSPVPPFRRFEVPLLGISHFKSDARMVELADAAAKDYIKTDLPQEIPADLLEEFLMTSPKVVRGLIASGDQFIASDAKLAELRRDLPETLCIEMEGAAVAQVCYEHDVPFVIIRSLSDKADHSAPIDFPGYLEHVASFITKGITLRMLAAM